MTRAQIEQLDAIANGTETTVVVLNRDGMMVTDIQAGRFLQRSPGFSTLAWIVSGGGPAYVAIYTGDKVEIEPGKITVRL
jgi:hypothetical protein